MKKKKYFYSSGEFARLTGVNKRTLHYYNDIGLFSPEVVGKNGYHYYTCFQFAQLELILTLRKIGLTLEEIQTYVTQASDEAFVQMIEKKKALIQDSIQQLLSVESFLNQKSARLQISLSAKHGAIGLCSLPQRKIIRSAPISGRYDEADFSVAADFSLRLKLLFHLYDSFGSRIAMDSIYQGDYTSYDSFFAYCPPSSPVYDEQLPQGTYLQTFCVGPWDQLPALYQTVLNYAKDHRLQLLGYAYEEGLNEMAITTEADYVTRITIQCVPTP